VALRKNMSTRDPENARPQDVREYDSRTGGYSRNPNDKPTPGAGNGTNGRLK
jgi:hypothetical protein